MCVCVRARVCVSVFVKHTSRAASRNCTLLICRLLGRSLPSAPQLEFQSKVQSDFPGTLAPAGSTESLRSPPPPEWACPAEAAGALASALAADCVHECVRNRNQACGAREGCAAGLICAWEFRWPTASKGEQKGRVLAAVDHRRLGLGRRGCAALAGVEKRDKMQLSHTNSTGLLGLRI